MKVNINTRDAIYDECIFLRFYCISDFVSSVWISETFIVWSIDAFKSKFYCSSVWSSISISIICIISCFRVSCHPFTVSSLLSSVGLVVDWSHDFSFVFVFDGTNTATSISILCVSIVSLQDLRRQLHYSISSLVDSKQWDTSKFVWSGFEHFLGEISAFIWIRAEVVLHI